MPISSAGNTLPELDNDMPQLPGLLLLLYPLEIYFSSRYATITTFWDG